MEFLNGSGSMQTGTNGEQSFRYAFASKAYASLNLSPEEVRQAHISSIETWIGTNSFFPLGYNVLSNTKHGDTLLYSGSCK